MQHGHQLDDHLIIALFCHLSNDILDLFLSLQPFLGIALKLRNFLILNLGSFIFALT